MQRIRKWLWLASAIIFPVSGNAQTLSLKELINKVSQNAPSLLTEQANVKVKQAVLKDSRFNWIPSLKLNYQADIGTSDNVQSAYFTFGIVPSSSGGIAAANNTQPVASTLAVGALDWELYNFGAYEARNLLARSDLAAEQNRYQLTAYDLQGYAIEDYLELLRLNALLIIQQENIDRNTQLKQSVAGLTNSGLRPGVDTSIADAELSKARLNYIEVQNLYNHVQIQLSTISGLTSGEIRPDTSLLTKLSLYNPYDLFATPDTQNHPLIKLYQSLYQSSVANEKVTKRNFNPKLLLEADGWVRGSSIQYPNTYESLNTGFSPKRPNYLVGLAVVYDLFSIPKMRLKMQVQKSETMAALNQLKEQQTNLTGAIENAKVEMETANKRLQEIPRQLSAANDAYNRQLNLYKSGLVTIFDLDAALQVLYRAETDYATARDSYYKALFRMAYATNQVTPLLNLF